MEIFRRTGLPLLRAARRIAFCRALPRRFTASLFGLRFVFPECPSLRRAAHEIWHQTFHIGVERPVGILKHRVVNAVHGRLRLLRNLSRQTAHNTRFVLADMIFYFPLFFRRQNRLPADFTHSEKMKKVSHPLPQTEKIVQGDGDLSELAPERSQDLFPADARLVSARLPRKQPVKILRKHTVDRADHIFLGQKLPDALPDNIDRNVISHVQPVLKRLLFVIQRPLSQIFQIKLFPDLLRADSPDTKDHLSPKLPERLMYLTAGPQGFAVFCQFHITHIGQPS